ncbi:MAG TPA: efflux RND transporter periplasmic adaptor subunit [Patescibacteria group bacterium]|jgi:multidrug resistance efflux pump|nr:efflux RND transporter periplasmic adaptor subunit [Patescibacteria group bacterium]
MKNLIAKIKNPQFLRVILVVIVAVLLIGGYIGYQLLRDRVSIEDSLVQAPIITISPEVPGAIIDVKVYEGERVKKGDTLAIVGTSSLNAYQDGLVVSTDNAIGSLASSQTPVVEMINFADMRIAGTIDENKGLDKIKVGQVVSFTVDAIPGQTFWGYVDEISPTAKQTQLQFSVSSERPTQQFIVYARFNAFGYPQIKNGMSAKMTVYTNTP